MAEAAAKTEAEAAPKESAMGFYMAVLIATGIAVGAGWVLGGQLSVQPDVQKAKTADTSINGDGYDAPKTDEKMSDYGYGDKSGEEAKDGKEKDGKGGYAGSIVNLDPILVALRNSNNAFLRLDLVVVMNEGKYLKDKESKLRLQSELSAFSKTMTLKQISGPSGYLHFREDLLDRARLATKGDIKDLLIMSMVAE